MDNFNFKKFLTENKLTKTSVLREGVGAYEYEKGKAKGEAEEKKKMTKEELKQKIKEMIIAELSLAEENDVVAGDYNFVAEGSDDEDYEKSSREVEFGVNPDKEEFDLKDFFMDDEKSVPEIPMFKGTKNALDDLKIKEAKKKKDDAPEEELDLDLGEETPEGEEDVNIDFSQEAPASEDNFNIDTSAVDPNIKAVQDALTQAQAAAEKIQDEKLTQQIGNTITMFTRTHIANKEPIREYFYDDEDYAEGANNQYVMNDEDGWELDKRKVEKYVESTSNDSEFASEFAYSDTLEEYTETDNIENLTDREIEKMINDAMYVFIEQQKELDRPSDYYNTEDY